MNIKQAEAWVGRTAVDDDGSKLGKIEDVWVDDETGEPEWVTVKTGLFGSHVSFVPLRGASEADDDVPSPGARAAWRTRPAWSRTAILTSTAKRACSATTA